MHQPDQNELGGEAKGSDAAPSGPSAPSGSRPETRAGSSGATANDPVPEHQGGVPESEIMSGPGMLQAAEHLVGEELFKAGMSPAGSGSVGTSAHPLASADFDSLIISEGLSDGGISGFFGLDVADFDPEAHFVLFPSVTGTTSFEVRATDMLAFLSVLEFPIAAAGFEDDVVELTLSSEDASHLSGIVNLRGHSHSKVQLVRPASFLQDAGVLKLVVSFRALQKACMAADMFVRFTLQPEKKRLVCTSKHFERSIVVQSADKFRPPGKPTQI